MRKNFVQEVNFLLAACVSGGSLLASYAHAAETGVAPASLNSAQVVNAPISAPPEAEKAAGTPSDGEEVPSEPESERGLIDFSQNSADMGNHQPRVG
ncbi:hypothetical protein [Acetobacter lambici]|uniref:Uncharacterized protein n=1 Tax=Acetobacter lambici TaxID=1332824 RepID=A0ABT1F103_9PROT|nr:hypothetical protein [Acetobacter lambici]MCP1258870.1 hypothetical protein [Acetobacter lambici]